MQQFFDRKNVPTRAQFLMCRSSSELFYSFTVEHNKKKEGFFLLICC